MKGASDEANSGPPTNTLQTPKLNSFVDVDIGMFNNQLAMSAVSRDSMIPGSGQDGGA